MVVFLKNNNKNVKIIVLGNNGMLGRYVYTYFKTQNFNVVGFNRNDIDATLCYNEELVEEKIKTLDINEGDVIINCIGLIKQRGDVKKTDFIIVNSIFPLYLSNVCERFNIKLIHPTTDCVYSGNKGNYIETDEYDVNDIYGVSKFLGESINATIIRTSIIGEELNNKLSLVEWVKSNKGNTINGYVNHIWNGVTCLQFAKICENIINNNYFWKGVKHYYSNSVSKYELVKIISEIYNLNIIVNKYEAPVKCDRSLYSINKLDCYIPSLYDQILEMKSFNLL